VFSTNQIHGFFYLHESFYRVKSHTHWFACTCSINSQWHKPKPLQTALWRWH